MNISSNEYKLLELMPQGVMVVDVKAYRTSFVNSAFKRMFAENYQFSMEDSLRSITHNAFSKKGIMDSIRQDLQTTGKSVLKHVKLKTKDHPSEYFDLHIAFFDHRKEAVYVIFALSEHQLAQMVQQNTYYDIISQARYSSPFHLDVKARRIEFFNPEIETSDGIPLILENYPESLFQYGYLYEEDKAAFVQAVERMYQGEPPQGRFRFYDYNRDLAWYRVNYVVNRDGNGVPIEVIGDFYIESETTIDTEASAIYGEENQQKVVLSHQIKANFFFDTLNTIAALCKQDAAKADGAICTFATYMRSYMYLVNEEGMVPFDDELNLVKRTLEIEKLRFPDNFVYELDIEDLDFHVPPLFLQPLVENALLHSLRRTGYHGTLNIGVHQVGDTIQVTVSDDGMGFNTNVLNKTKSVGLKNLTRRIQMMLGGTITIESELGVGTEVTIQIPLMTAGGDESC